MPCSEADFEAVRPLVHAFAVRYVRRRSTSLAPEDARAEADLALVRAARRFDPDRGVRFETFARRWVAGALRDVLRRERRAGLPSPGHDAAWTLTRRDDAATPEATCLGRQLLERLPPGDRRVLVDHAVGDEPLASIAGRAGHHRAWALRRYRRARRHLQRVA